MHTATSSDGQIFWTEALQRPRYFARQLVTPAELNLESRYFMARLRRHNRLLHGWGVICGAKVCAVWAADGSAREPWKIEIHPGHLIDGYGNDIHVDMRRVVDIRATDVTVGCGDAGGEPADPWCADVWKPRDEAGTVFVAVCHAERLARPVRAQPSGCGCDDIGCEYSRWQDGYRIRFLDGCPETHAGDPPTPTEILAQLSGPLRECPECPEDPCVVLARVDFDADGTITAIDNCSCRRNVVSLANLWWRCASTPVTVDEVATTPPGPHARGTKDIELVITGENLREDATAYLGPGVTETNRKPGDGGKTLTLIVDVHEKAAPGSRTLVVKSPDCSTASFADALTIVEEAAKPKRRR